MLLIRRYCKECGGMTTVTNHKGTPAIVIFTLILVTNLFTALVVTAILPK